MAGAQIDIEVLSIVARSRKAVQAQWRARTRPRRERIPAGEHGRARVGVPSRGRPSGFMRSWKRALFWVVLALALLLGLLLLAYALAPEQSASNFVYDGF